AVHVQNFEGGEAGVAAAKAEILTGLQPGGVAVLNADDRWFEYLAGEARKVGARVKTFGARAGSDALLRKFETTPTGSRVAAVVDGLPTQFALRQSGAHWGPMSLCVLLMLRALDVELRTGIEALGDFAPLAGRGAEQTVRATGRVFTLVDESYNANPI